MHLESTAIKYGSTSIDAAPVRLARVSALALAGALGLASPAYGQEVAPPQGPSDQIDTAAQPSNDIIVTARRREERLQDVPISINVTSGEALEDLSLNQFIALQQSVPNLSITDTPANASIFIRGIGTSGNTLTFEQSVALFVDQVYGGRNRQFMNPFFDVDRIEVLRGPQGALFGRNTSAGAISVTTRRPTTTVEGMAAAEYELVTGSYNMTLVGSGPVSDTLALRFGARYNKGIGFLENVTLNRVEPVRDEILARASALWQPSPTFSVFGKLEYGKMDILGTPFEFVPNAGRPRYIIDHDDGLVPLRDNSNSLGGVLQVEIGIGTHRLTAITGYSEFDYVNSFNIQARRPARLVTQNEESFWQLSQEVRLASPTGGAFDYLVGAYAETSRSNIFRLSVINLPPPPVPNNETHRWIDQSTDVLAFFGGFNWSPIEQIRLSGELRWTKIEKEGALRGFARVFNLNGTRLDIPRAPLAATFTEEYLSPSFTASWRPNPNVNLYARYAEGSKGGAFSEFQAVTSETFILRPEKSQSYEAGLKLQLPAVRGFLNIAGFVTDYTDLQKSSIDVNTASFVTSNAAGARTQGVELDAGFRPVETLRVTLSGAYLDAKYTFYPNGPCAFPNHLIPNCVEDRTGDRLQNSPRWSGNIAFDLDQPIGAALRLLGHWSTSYQSDINYQDILHPLEVQPAHSKSNARLALASADDTWEFGLLVRNVFDERTSGIIFQTFPVGTTPQDRVHMPDPKRTFTLQGRMRF